MTDMADVSLIAVTGGIDVVGMTVVAWIGAKWAKRDHELEVGTEQRHTENAAKWDQVHRRLDNLEHGQAGIREQIARVLGILDYIDPRKR